MPPAPQAISFGGMKSLTRISALIAPMLVLALAACGEESPTDDDTTEESSDATEASDGAETSGGDFCATVAEVSAYFGLIEDGMTADSAETAASAAEARALLEAADPPAEIADDWAGVTAFYVAVDDAFAASEPEAGKSSFEVLGDAALAIPDTVAGAENGITAVENYAETDCEGGAAPAEAADLDGACGMLTEEDLSPMFASGVPEPDDRSWGPDAQECVWENDRGSIVSVMYQSREDFTSNFLEASGEPEFTVGDVENGEVHPGLYGIMSFDTSGSSMYFTVGDWGGVVGVRIGEDGTPAHDEPMAVEYGRKVVEQLS